MTTLVVATTLVAAPSAQAVVTCTYDDAANDALVEITGDVPTSGSQAVLELGAFGLIIVNTNPCLDAGGTEAAAVSNIDTVRVLDTSNDETTPVAGDGSTSLSIDDPASFAPGVVDESGTTDEIEFFVGLGTGREDYMRVFGTNGPDNWVAGSGGINWNADSPDSDADLIPLSEFDAWELFGNEAADTLSGQRGSGTDAPFDSPFVLALQGSEGGDTLLGGNSTVRGDILRGDEGNDTLAGFAGDDALFGQLGDDTLDGGPGALDSARFFELPTAVTIDLGQTAPQNTGQGTDTITGVEEVQGSSLGDTLIGDAGANSFFGGDGNDTLDGRGGPDALRGNSGVDTLTYAQAPAGVDREPDHRDRFGQLR